MIADNIKSKLEFVNKCRDNGHKLVKIVFKPNRLMMSEHLDEELYFDISSRRGRKQFYSIPCTQYIDNDWKQRAFYLSNKFKDILNSIDIFDEAVTEISKEETMALLEAE